MACCDAMLVVATYLVAEMQYIHDEEGYFYTSIKSHTYINILLYLTWYGNLCYGIHKPKRQILSFCMNYNHIFNQYNFNQYNTETISPMVNAE